MRFIFHLSGGESAEDIVLITMMATLVVLASFISILLNKLKFPSLIGFLIAGIIIANYADISDEAYEIVEIFATLGLIMLMFTIGMEIDVRKLKFQGKFAIIVSAVQIPFMLICGIVFGALFGLSFVQSLVFGAIMSGSSTAVVLAVQKSSKVLDHDKVEVLILMMIIEDICQVIMLSLLTPMMTGGDLDADSMVVLVASIVIFMVACFTMGLMAIPRALNWIYDRSDDELISLFCIGMLFVFAWAANFVGLSVAIGAFLAGVIVGSSRSKEPVEHYVDPLKSLFMAIFFISVGTEVSLTDLANNIPTIIIIYVVFTVCMFSAVNLGYWTGNGDPRCGWISAVSICTMGEFAFIISKEALRDGVIDQAFYSSVIGAAIISMLILPSLVRISNRSYYFWNAKCPRRLKNGILALNRERDNFYHGIETVSFLTRERFRKGLTNVFVLTIMVIIIEIGFFLAYTPLADWLHINIGTLSEYGWRQVILAVNIIVLLEPCRRIAEFIRLALYVYERGREASEPKVYQQMSSILVGGVATLIIVIVVPNGIDNLTHFLVLGGILAVFVLMQIRKYKNDSGAKEMAEEAGPPAPEEDQRIQQ